MEWMNKRVLLLVFCAFGICANLHAQTWSEWFSQKKTQRKYLLEQLAALKAYAGYLKKGYEIGRSGLSFIKDASQGELDLHVSFFSSLKKVNPVISNYVKVAGIIRMQLNISKALGAIAKMQGIDESHQRYISMVINQVRTESKTDLDELLLLITSGRLELTDDERLVRIDRLYQEMEQKVNFTLSFADGARLLLAQRRSELETIHKMEEWYENK